jgi:hypothetical protein
VTQYPFTIFFAFLFKLSSIAISNNQNIYETLISQLRNKEDPYSFQGLDKTDLMVFSLFRRGHFSLAVDGDTIVLLLHSNNYKLTIIFFNVYSKNTEKNTKDRNYRFLKEGLL